MIDWAQMVTPEDLAAEAKAADARAAKAECVRRINNVAPLTSQLNMVAAAAAGAMTGPEMTAYRAFLVWTGGTRDAWKVISGDPMDDAKWPIVPKPVADLTRRF